MLLSKVEEILKKVGHPVKTGELKELYQAFDAIYNKRNLFKEQGKEETILKQDYIRSVNYKFISDNIRSSIKSGIQEEGLQITLSDGEDTVRVCLFGKSPNQIFKYKNKILRTLQFVLKLKKPSAHIDEIVIFLTDQQKKIEYSKSKTQRLILTSNEVNTGLTSTSLMKNKIVLWREEEVVKVLAHELIHALDMDFGDHEHKMISLFKKTLNVTKKVLLSEAYTEIWARLINCYLCSTSQASFIHNFEIDLVFSMIQFTKITEFSNNSQPIELEKLLYVTDKHTNVFPYYMLCSCLMFSIDGFLSICKSQDNYVNFDEENVKKMHKLFMLCLQNNTFYSLCKKIKNGEKNKELENTMRMTLIEC